MEQSFQASRNLESVRKDGPASPSEVRKSRNDSFHATINRLSAGKNHLGTREAILLVTLGVLAGAISGLTLWAAEQLSYAQVLLINAKHLVATPTYYFLSAIVLAIIPALIIKYFCRQAAGSGLPEFKAILAGEMKPSERAHLVSFRIFVAKIIGLTLSSGSGLSIGTEGPLVHISACIAHLLMSNISEFVDILDSPSLSRQIFAASAAVGISSAFNAPVGGLLFSVEITSTFYLISNYWKSFVASMAGAFACSLFLFSRQSAGQYGVALEMDISDTPYIKWELFIFLLIGLCFAYLAHWYLKLNQIVHLLMKPYCKRYPIIMCALVASITAVVIYYTRAHTPSGLRVFSIAGDVLTSGYVAEMRSFQLIPPLVGVLVMAITRTFITMLGFNLPIPAGTFVPVFLIGALLGRFVGLLVAMNSSLNVYMPGYAIVGGCAFASGVTQSISVAVVAIELTGNYFMLLPCLIASVVAAGITRKLGLSVYDRAMFNKGLESLQLLLQESTHGFRSASDVMCTGSDVVCITRVCSPMRLLHILDENHDSQFPLVVDDKSRKLLGTLTRFDVFEFLKAIFHERDMDELLEILLPEDYLEHEEKAFRVATKAGQKRLREKILLSFSLKQPHDISKDSAAMTQKIHAHPPPPPIPHRHGPQMQPYESSLGSVSASPETHFKSLWHVMAPLPENGIAESLTMLERGDSVEDQDEDEKQNGTPRRLFRRDIRGRSLSVVHDENFAASLKIDEEELERCNHRTRKMEEALRADTVPVPQQADNRQRSPSIVEKVSTFLGQLLENHDPPAQALPGIPGEGLGQPFGHRTVSIEKELDAYTYKDRSRSTTKDTSTNEQDPTRGATSQRAFFKMRNAVKLWTGDFVIEPSRNVYDDAIFEGEADSAETNRRAAAEALEDPRKTEFRDILNIEIDLLNCVLPPDVINVSSRLTVNAFPFRLSSVSFSFQNVLILLDSDTLKSMCYVLTPNR
jgi:H+/Cl- antiporter ClcA